MPNSNKSSGVDKQLLYGEYLKGVTRQNRLYDKATHKALDVAEDDMGFNQEIDRSNRGISWKELAVLALGGLGAYGLWSYNQEDKVPIVPPAQVAPIDSEYDVRFYDSEGNLIDVPHVSELNGKAGEKVE